MDLDYNKLRYFMVVVSSGGITAAAKILHRTQSAISQAIQSLEKQLGVKLVIWEGKKLKLTREGRLVYDAVKDKFPAINKEITSILNTAGDVSGKIEIGVIQDHSTQAIHKLNQAIASFKKSYPNVTFNLQLNTSSQIEKALLNSEIDFGFIINFKECFRFQVSPFCSSEHLLVGSNKYISKHKRIDSLAEVLNADLIDIDSSMTCIRSYIKKYDIKFLDDLRAVDPAIVVPDFLVIKELLLLDQGIAVLPRCLIKKELENGAFVQLFPNLGGLNISVDVCYQKGRDLRVCEQLFWDFLLSLDRSIFNF